MASNLQNFHHFLFSLIIILFLSKLSRSRLLINDEQYSSSVVALHEQWMIQHGRVYKDETEKAKRFNIFKENALKIDDFNRGEYKGYKLGINGFADLTNEEFIATRNGYKKQEVKTSFSRKPFKYGNVSDVPITIDWREKKAVTGVKDQGECGCCWAFSAVAAIEGINRLKTGELVSLSEQQLVDCDVNGEDAGCEGGLMDNAFEYILHNKGGVTSETSYPYTGEDGTCNAKKTSNLAAKITGYEDVPANNEKALLQAVAHQPVSVAIDASGYEFQFYKSGVLGGECDTNLDHGVTAVGFGTTSDGTKYWLVKNSWGANWGENGYIRMKRDIDAKEGFCGIAMQASYPVA